MQYAGFGFNLLIVSSEANYPTICPDFWLSFFALWTHFKGPSSCLASVASNCQSAEATIGRLPVTESPLSVFFSFPRATTKLR